MSEVNWDEFKCRCSGIKKLLATKPGEKPISETGLRKIAEFEEKMKLKPLAPGQKIEYAELIQKRDKPPKVELADGAIEYLMEVYAWKTEGMIPVNKESMDLLQLRKGKQCEVDAKALLSAVDGFLYETHKERIENEFLSGEVDYFLGTSIYEATNVTDCKNAFDYPGFLRKINGGLENGQREQVAGYGDITGAKELFIANCLVDNPIEVIEEIRWKVMKKMGIIDDSVPSFVKEWERWERSMKFSHIAPNKRVHKIPVEPFTEFERQAIYDRVKFCRNWLWEFDEFYKKMNL